MVDKLINHFLRTETMTATKEARIKEAIQQAELFNNPIERISRSDFIVFLLQNEKTGARFVELYSRGKVHKMNKSKIVRGEKAGEKGVNRFDGKVVKVSTKNGRLNWFYGNAVNNQRDREEIFEKFVPQKRTWGEYICNPFLLKKSKTVIDHTKFDKKTEEEIEYGIYVNFKFERSDNIYYEWKESGVRLSEKEVVEMMQFVAYPTKSKTQETEKEIIVNNFNIMTIEMMKIDKVLYVLND